MARPPYMNFPFPFQRNYYGAPFFPHNMQCRQTNNIRDNSTATNNNEGNKFNEEKRENFKEKNKSNKYADDYLFDLFGLKIYNDDVLLVSLIYFLYSEGVKDDGLFIVLILLLLS